VDAAALIIVLVIVLALFFDFTNGFHDTANAIATSVATKALRPQYALAMATAFNFIGAFAGTAVAKTIGAGISQNDPRYTHEWLFDWIKSGWLAEAAMSGFLDGRQFGVYNIQDVIFRGIKEPDKSYQLL